eukprot:56296_1
MAPIKTYVYLVLSCVWNVLVVLISLFIGFIIIGGLLTANDEETAQHIVSEMVNVIKLCEKQGWNDLQDAHISIFPSDNLVHDNSMDIFPTFMVINHYSGPFISNSDFVSIQMQNLQTTATRYNWNVATINENKKWITELLIHRAIHPSVNYVLHLNTPNMRKNLYYHEKVKLFSNKILYIDYIGGIYIKTIELDKLSKIISEKYKCYEMKNVIFIRNYGVVILASSLTDLLKYAYELDTAIETQLQLFDTNLTCISNNELF